MRTERSGSGAALHDTVTLPALFVAFFSPAVAVAGIAAAILQSRHVHLNLTYAPASRIIARGEPRCLRPPLWRPGRISGAVSCFGGSPVCAWRLEAPVGLRSQVASVSKRRREAQARPTQCGEIPGQAA